MDSSSQFEERFWSQVDKTDTCWLWTGAMVWDGYGRIEHNNARHRVHRVAYELLVGPIPDGLQIDHLCRVRNCVNPAHLEPVTCRENLARSTNFIAENIRKTHCPKGHPYDEANTQVKNGHRHCLACRSAWNKAYHEAHKEQIRARMLARYYALKAN